MNEITPVETDPSHSVDELDVEGHGLKEVTVGLSTMAILATGAASLMHAQTKTNVPGGGASAGGAGVSTPVNASRTRGLGQVQADASVSGESTATAVGSVSGAAQDAAGRARSIDLEEHGDPQPGSDPIGEVDRAVDQTIAQTRQVRDAALSKVRATVTATEAAARTAVRETQQEVAARLARAEAQVEAARATAQATAREVTRKVITVVHAVATEDPKALVVSLTKVTASGSVDATNASGTVTVSSGGVVVGTATVKTGEARIELTAPVVGTHGVTITYGGDSIHAPSTATV